MFFLVGVFQITNVGLCLTKLLSLAKYFGSDVRTRATNTLLLLVSMSVMITVSSYNFAYVTYFFSF